MENDNFQSGLEALCGKRLSSNAETGSFPVIIIYEHDRQFQRSAQSFLGWQTAALDQEAEVI